MQSTRFDDYKKDIIRAYTALKNENELSPNLLRHTPAKLKQECIDVFPERYSDKDRNTFTAFFGRKDSAAAYFRELDLSNPSVFKPLNTFLKNTEGIATSDKNIELLAWLIDYQPRPHQPLAIGEIGKAFNLGNDTDTHEISKPNEIYEDNKRGGEEREAHEEKPEENLVDAIPGAGLGAETDETAAPQKTIFGIPAKFKKTVIAFLAAAIILTGSYVAYKLSPHECMYWDGLKYQEIACNEKVEGAAVIAIDTFELAHVKLITDLSSITRNDIRKIYYSKESGEVKFYTGKGENPKDTRKRLLPMTEYIYEKYVQNRPVK